MQAHDLRPRLLQRLRLQPALLLRHPLPRLGSVLPRQALLLQRLLHVPPQPLLLPLHRQLQRTTIMMTCWG